VIIRPYIITLTMHKYMQPQAIININIVIHGAWI